MTKNVTLTYTDEMKTQDALWENEQEDSDIMERLFQDIVNEAKANGYTGIANIYQRRSEALCELYDDENHQVAVLTTGANADIYDHCQSLIERLEDLCSGISSDFESRFETLDETFKITYVEGEDEEEAEVECLSWSGALTEIKEIQRDPNRELVSVRQVKMLDFLG